MCRPEYFISKDDNGCSGDSEIAQLFTANTTFGANYKNDWTCIEALSYLRKFRGSSLVKNNEVLISPKSLRDLSCCYGTLDLWQGQAARLLCSRDSSRQPLLA